MNPYTYITIGTNKFSNDTFNNNINGISYFDGGGGYISIPVGEISLSKYYILKFSTLGTVANKTLFAYLKNKNSDVTPRIPAAVTNSRTENEILFLLPKTPPTSTTLIFTWDDSELGPTFYLDNVELYEAKVTYTNPDNYIRFKYNATNSAKTISLDKRYIDALNNQYQNKISLNPFSSVILFTTDSQVP